MDQKALIEAYKEVEKALLESQRTDLIYGVREGAPPIAPWPTQPCKLVFLDFDGVLNSDLSVAQLGTRYRFWPPSIKALNHVLQESGACVVITSTWREHWTLSENAAALERDGLLPRRVVGKTAASGGERGLEIDSWLRSVPYPVKSFVILDDRNDMAMHRSRLIQIDPRAGLGWPQAQRAIELLAAP
jgi:HAD domain in Swiss Army Knife RNA repair proteins